MANKPKVVIIGGGFGGLQAAKALANKDVEVALIDRKNHHTFQPLLYQVATAVLSPGEIASPIRRILHRADNIEVVLGEVVSFDLTNNKVKLHDGSEIPFDYLIVAAGARHSYFGHDDWETNAPGLKTVEDAVEIRRRVLLAFELAERDAYITGVKKHLNFVVIGGGATGVEMAGAIAGIARLALANDFKLIDTKRALVQLFKCVRQIAFGTREKGFGKIRCRSLSEQFRHRCRSRTRKSRRKMDQLRCRGLGDRRCRITLRQRFRRGNRQSRTRFRQ
jgi:NADH:ubiquinone reductase (H+-translocating)